MTPPDRLVVDERFLRDREHAGVSRDALKAVYPRRCWPAEWITEDDQEKEDDQ